MIAGKSKSRRSCSCGDKLCNCARKKRPRPAFNSSVKLGTRIGLHPKLCPRTDDSPGVGSYDPRPIASRSGPTRVVRYQFGGARIQAESQTRIMPLVKKYCVLFKNMKGHSLYRSFCDWDREMEAKEFSATMGGRFLEKYAKQRDLMKRGLGPGIHEIPQWPESILEKPCKSVREDVGFGTVPLFQSAYLSTTPGPGCTPKVHDPYYYLDQKRRKGFGCVPSFEYDGLRPRFREIRKSWSLPCNRYKVVHPLSLEATLKKVTGKRGPYDLFTGPRDETTLVGYQAAKGEAGGAGPRSLPGEMDKLLCKSNYFKGLWSTCPRFPKKVPIRLMLTDIALCYKDPNQPGPSHYSPSSPRKPRNARNYPFDSNIEYARPRTRLEIRPGPGRYKVKERRGIKGHGWTWVFKSNVERRAFHLRQPYNSF